MLFDMCSNRFKGTIFLMCAATDSRPSGAPLWIMYCGLWFCWKLKAFQGQAMLYYEYMEPAALYIKQLRHQFGREIFKGLHKYSLIFLIYLHTNQITPYNQILFSKHYMRPQFYHFSFTFYYFYIKHSQYWVHFCLHPNALVHPFHFLHMFFIRNIHGYYIGLRVLPWQTNVLQPQPYSNEIMGPTIWNKPTTI